MNQQTNQNKTIYGQHINSDLQVFSNQVGGHSCLLKFNQPSDFIMKPFNEQEYAFYEQIANQKQSKLLEFIPKCYGMYYIEEENALDIDIQDITNEEEFLLAQNSKIKQKSKSITGISIQSKEGKDDHFGLNVISSIINQAEDHPNRMATSSRSKSGWFKKLYLERYKRNTRYLKLQDLTLNMCSPCILDLKMGSISYNQHKVFEQSRKIANSTSSSSGFRICGLSVNQILAQKEEFRDKYWGRDIPNEKLINALALFFYDGKKLLLPLIDEYLQKLKLLYNTINECRGYRFNSASLLLIYDAVSMNQMSNWHENIDFNEKKSSLSEKESINPKESVVLKLIDFAKSEIDPKGNEPDHDLLNGIKNLKHALSYLKSTPNIQLYF